MALFTINRYFGDEQDSFSSKISEDVKSQRLDELLLHAKARKRKIDDDEVLQQTSEQDNTEQCTDAAKTSSKKKKKAKIKRNKDDMIKDKELSDTLDSSLENLTIKETVYSKSVESHDTVDSSHDTVDNSCDPTDDSHDLVDNLQNPVDYDDSASESTDSPQGSVDNEEQQSDTEYFPVLGGKAKHYEKPVVLRKLPAWMENPTLVEVDIKENAIPVDELAVTLPNVIQRNLQRMCITKLFPVQYHVMPGILSAVHGPLLGNPSGERPQDICVNAPTGSGKTLAYAIPIVTALINRVVCYVRGLIVVPSRDLALQVRAVLLDVAKGTGLKIVTITGQSPMEKEQSELVDQNSIPISSGADIVVATPGRLVDHMSLTRYFCLTHLRFLVIDEVDRLLDQSFQDWITKLFDFIGKDEKHPKTLSLYSCLTANDMFPHQISDSKFDILIPVPHSPSSFHTTTAAHCNVQKLLFSATIPQNPEKLALLKLYSPKLFTTGVIQDGRTDDVNNYTGRFALPSTLKEYSIVCPAKYKPLAVIHLIENEKINRILCFTSSKDSTHRLYLLLKHYGISGVAEYSAGLPQNKRRFVLSEFSCGNVNMLVCSDAMSRGMDVDKVDCLHIS